MGVVLGLTLGCGPTLGEPVESDAAGSSSGPAGSSSLASATAATTIDGTATVDPPPSTQTTAGESTASPTDDSTTGDAMCDDVLGRALASVMINHLERSVETIAIDEVCQVTEASDASGTEVLELSCPSGEYELLVSSVPMVELVPPLDVGVSINVRALRNFPIDYGAYQYVAIHALTGDLIVGYYGYGTPAGVDPVTLLSPVTFEVEDGVCPIIPYEPGGGFIEAPCDGDRELLGLTFDDGQDQVVLYDGDSGTLGALEIRVGQAERTFPATGNCELRGPIDAISWTALRVR